MSTIIPHAELKESENINAHIPRTSDRGSNDDPGASQSIFFEDHLCETYVWPFKLCRTYEAIKPLIEEVYRSRSDDHHIEEVRSARYDIKTAHGAIILPSLWSFVVEPSSTIKISFRRNHAQMRESSPVYVGRRQRSPIPDTQSDIVYAPQYARRPQEYVEEITVDVDDRPLSAFGPYAGSNPEDRVSVNEEIEDSEEDSDSLLSSSDQDDEQPKDISSQKITREVPPLIDSDGNTLSFAIDTSKAIQQSVAQGVIEKHGNDKKRSQDKKGAMEVSAEKYRITKAVTYGTEARTTVQIYTLPGPDNDKLHDSVQVTWYHLHSSQLNLNRFKDICLDLPNLSSRLQLLVVEVLAQVERHKVKAFLDGFFIEPGTVLRTIEKCQPDAQAVVFSCIPYLELQRPPQRTSPKLGERLFPPRTLMQAMYPYEPVRDRDSEQAYKKLGGDQSNSLIYVPNLWMMNIGGGVVVTYGHKPLADEMVKSIEVVQEDLSQLGATDIVKNSLTTIRLVDQEALVHVYSLESCRSYFQVEVKLDKSNVWSNVWTRGTRNSDSLKMIWNSPSGTMAVTAYNWNTIIKRTDLIYINLEVMQERSLELATEQFNLDEMTAANQFMPPFFHWASSLSDIPAAEKVNMQNTTPVGLRHEKQCLEIAEKGMLSETLDRHSTVNAVDRSFASTTYYQSLPAEDTHEHVSEQFRSLCSGTSRTSYATYHATVVANQCSSIVTKSDSFCKVVQVTLSLFVSDTSNSDILRKVWSAMGNIHKWAAKVQARGPVEPNVPEPSEPGNQYRRVGTTGWYIRGGKEGSLPLLDADKKLKRSVKHCRRCTGALPFEDTEAAINHLRSHVKPATSYIGLPSEGKASVPASTGELKLRDWIIHSNQLKLENSNAGGLKILAQACDDALDLLGQIKELANGVRNEDGRKSDLYTFPRELTEAFRKLIVFYLGTERALYHTEESYQHAGEGRNEAHDLPYSEDGLNVLKRFAQGVANSVVTARDELCSMVKPDISTDPMQNLSLGPEYICGWLMRRLLVKPLEKRMSVGDMYREYLSTIQFQVNHRPGKRLIRDLNLLQEELQVLAMINTWQTNLTQNYMRVLDDKTFEIDAPSRRAMFPYERMLLQSSLENLALAREEYNDLTRRCGPLSDQTKQSLEIYEEDHGKAITAFTVVTVIFLPLSFVTSYFGMNTVDIRDMASGQSLFWAVALPLTFVTIGATVLIGYNGDVLRDTIASVYHKIIGRQDSSMSARGISVAQRKRAKQLQDDANSSLDTSIADEAEYAKPQPETNLDEWYNNGYVPYTYAEAIEPVSRMAKMEPYVPAPRARFRTQRLHAAPMPPPPMYEEPAIQYSARHVSRPVDYRVEGKNYTSRVRPMAAAIAYDASIRQDEIDGLQDEYMWHKKRRHRHIADEGHIRR